MTRKFETYAEEAIKSLESGPLFSAELGRMSESVESYEDLFDFIAIYTESIRKHEEHSRIELSDFLYNFWSELDFLREARNTGHRDAGATQWADIATSLAFANYRD